MESVGKAIFNMQRMMILQLKVNPQTSDTIPDDYVYAWYNKIYPFSSEGELHADLEEYFEISKEQVGIVSKYLDDNWLDKKLFNFYELEEHYDCRTNPKHGIDRWVLIYILRYFKIQNGFNEKFWEKMLETLEHPSEAKSILTPFSADEIYFI